MVRHVVTLTFRPDLSDDAIDDVVAEIAALPTLVPTVRSYSVGRDLEVDGGNATVAIVADFDDVAAYEAYRDHPEHRRVITEHVRPVLTSRSAAQIDLDMGH